MPKASSRKKSGEGPSPARSADSDEALRGAPMTRAAAEASRPLQFTRLNWVLLAAGAVISVAGYVALASSSPFVSTVVAPILLVAAYVVLIPLGLIL